MTVGYATSLRNARQDAINAAINAGSGAGKIRIYGGTRPATGGAATTLLAELAVTDPFAPAAAAAVLTANSISDDANADNTGTATWFRILDSNDAFVLDGDCGLSGSGADMILNDVNVVQGGVFSISSFTITGGNA